VSNYNLRLTLASCVSELTSFSSIIAIDLLDKGFEPVHLELFEKNPDLPDIEFKIVITPGLVDSKGKPTELNVTCFERQWEHEEPFYNPMGTMAIARGNMAITQLYKCALHLAGDFIKFYRKG